MRSLLLVLLVLSFNLSAFASQESQELDPFSPNVEQVLKEYDKVYLEETGLSPFLPKSFRPVWKTCVRSKCKVWIQVVKSTQLAYLYINGQHAETWKVSTGVAGRGTPNFDKHPNGRVYDKYTSSKYPGGDFQGLGNMPYAVFIEGGFAIHGTPKSNWPKLGKKASHGCIRLHPTHAQTFNRLVRQYGIYESWVTVQD